MNLSDWIRKCVRFKKLRGKILDLPDFINILPASHFHPDPDTTLKLGKVNNGKIFSVHRTAVWLFKAFLMKYVPVSNYQRIDNFKKFAKIVQTSAVLRIRDMWPNIQLSSRLSGEMENMEQDWGTPCWVEVNKNKLGSNNKTQREEGKIFCCPTVFWSHKYHKIVTNFIFEQVKKFFKPEH